MLAQSQACVVVFLDACHSGAAALGSGDQHEVAVGRLSVWHGCQPTSGTGPFSTLRTGPPG
jgi:hypothetical protein